MTRLEKIRVAILLERNAVDLRLESQLSVLLVAVPDESPYYLLV